MQDKKLDNPFQALSKLRAQLPNKPTSQRETPVNNGEEEKIEKENKLPSNHTNDNHLNVTAPKPPESEKTIMERKEDETLQKEVFDILEIGEDRHYSKWKWGVSRAIRESREHNTSYKINQLIGFMTDSIKDPEKKARLNDIIDLLLRRANESGAVKSLIAATPNGMKYGTSSKETRIAEAREFAKKSGLSLSEIIKKHSIKIDLQD